MKLAIVGEGDPQTNNCWSGLAGRFVAALRRAGITVETFDAELYGWRRATAAAVSWRPRRAVWRQRYLYGAPGFRLRSALADRVGRDRYDAVIQIGATFLVSPAALHGAPLIVYCDANAAFSARGAPWSSVSHLPPPVLARVLERERRVYGAARHIWTTSEAARQSFLTDLNVSQDRVTAIFAGGNVTPDDADQPRAAGPPLILFVGKDHTRKGSDVVLRAFPEVRAAVPDAELHFIGSRPPEAAGPGVFAHGFVRSDQPEGRRFIANLYGRATVFCLPSHYEPFGVVFVEAMLAGLPCIGADRWAMPEIIQHGVTGWVVPENDHAALAKRLIEASTARETSGAMGRAGRARALEMFTWDHVASRAIADLRRLAPSP